MSIQTHDRHAFSAVRVGLHRRRAAFTLLEAVISMTVISSTMVIAVSLVTLAQRSTEQVNSSRRFRQQVRQFSEAYRDDARRAGSDLMLSGDNEVIIHSADQTVSYRLLNDSEISRVALGLGQPNRLLESYEFGDSVTVKVVQTNQEGPVQWIFTHKRFSEQPVTVIGHSKEGKP